MPWKLIAGAQTCTLSERSASHAVGHKSFLCRGSKVETPRVRRLQELPNCIDWGGNVNDTLSPAWSRFRVSAARTKRIDNGPEAGLGGGPDYGKNPPDQVSAADPSPYV